MIYLKAVVCMCIIYTRMNPHDEQMYIYGSKVHRKRTLFLTFTENLALFLRNIFGGGIHHR